MRRTKKGISLLLTVLLSLNLLIGFTVKTAIYVEAATAPTITVGTVSGAQGETVEVPVSISGNPGIVSFYISVAFDDSKVKLTGVQNGTVLNDPSHSGTLTTNPYKLCFAMDLSPVNNTENGVIATLSFEILKSFKPGDTAITVDYNPNEIYDIDYNNVTFNKVNGKITVSEADTPSITVGTDSGSPGETVNVPVSIANNPGIISLNASIAYDSSKLRLIDVKNGDVLTDPSHSGSLATNPYKLCFNMDLSPVNITANGVIATLAFEIISETQPDEIPITISYLPDDIFDFDTDNVYFLTVNGKVNVVNTHTVTFKDYDGSVLDTQTITRGEAAIAPRDPLRDGYDFIGWDVTFDNIRSDLVITAQYQIKTFTVTFMGYNNTTMATQTVNYGGTVTPPIPPAVEGYIFTGWNDKSFSNITAAKTITAVYVAFDDVPKIIVEDGKKGYIGKTVDVTVSLDDNPGVVSMYLSLHYDDTKLQLVNVTNGTILQDPAHGGNLSTNPYSLNWDGSLLAANITDNGAFVTLRFQVLKDIEEDDTVVSISYIDGNIFDLNGDDVFFYPVDGTISITSHISGDVNEDGAVNAKDVLRLRRYLAGGWAAPDDALNVASADVNGDDVVNAKDVLRLRRYLAGGWAAPDDELH
jgi:hypothetical protein